jgi:hypothetical protein
VGFHASRARFDLEPATYRPQVLVLVAVLEQHTAPLQQLGGLAPYLSRRAVGRGAESAAEGGGRGIPIGPMGDGGALLLRLGGGALSALPLAGRSPLAWPIWLRGA